MEKSYKQFTGKNGNKYQFNPKGLREARSKYKASHNLNLTKIDEMIAESLHVSLDSIKNYVKGANGPSELKMVKQMADILECNIDELLDEVEDENKCETNYCISIPTQPDVDLPIPTTELDVVNNVFIRLLYLLEHINETNNFRQLPATFDSTTKTISMPETGNDIKEEDKEKVLRYYNKYLLDTKAMADNYNVLLSKETDEKLMKIVREFTYSFSATGPGVEYEGIGNKISILSKISPEYEFAFYYFDAGCGAGEDSWWIAENTFRENEDIKVDLDEARKLMDPNYFDMFFYRGIESEQAYIQPEAFLEWTATQALKKLFANEFPQYYGKE